MLLWRDEALLGHKEGFFFFGNKRKENGEKIHSFSGLFFSYALEIWKIWGALGEYMMTLEFGVYYK